MNRTLVFLSALLVWSSCQVLNTNSNRNQHVQTPKGDPNYTGKTGCTAPMSAQGFEELQTAFAQYRFDAQKMLLLEQTVGDNCLEINQVRALVSGFEFEHYRLQALKKLYRRTYDIERFMGLSDLLEAESSRQELLLYVDAQP